MGLKNTRISRFSERVREMPGDGLGGATLLALALQMEQEDKETVIMTLSVIHPEPPPQTCARCPCLQRLSLEKELVTVDTCLSPSLLCLPPEFPSVQGCPPQPLKPLSASGGTFGIVFKA